MEDADSLRVLLIEDNPGDARLLEEYLRVSEQDLEIHWERELEAGMAALTSETRDVVVVDLGLPDSNGTETVRRCTNAAGSVPVVVLTGQQELGVALEALEAGAVEYLQKDELTPSLIARTLRWAVERARMEKELRLLSKAVDQSTEAILISEAGPIDEDGPCIVYVNPAFETMTGYPEEEVLGRSLAFLQGPETDQHVLTSLLEALEKGESWQGETVNYRKDDTPYIVQWNVAPVMDNDGEIEYWVSVQRDVTAIRQMWERLLDVQEEERRRIDQEIHDEVGGLLASIQMKAETVRVEAQNNGISTGPVDDMTELLNELSVAARTIVRQLHPRVLDQFGLLEALSNLVSKIEEQYDLEVDMHCTVESDDRYASLVERTAYRVIQEALLNVVRHAETDAAQVILHEDARCFHLHVIDEGLGFDSAEREEEENYGLKGITDRVERLNGTVEIDTAIGDGTEISATLPLTTSTFPAQYSTRPTNETALGR